MSTLAHTDPIHDEAQKIIRQLKTAFDILPPAVQEEQRANFEETADLKFQEERLVNKHGERLGLQAPFTRSAVVQALHAEREATWKSIQVGKRRNRRQRRGTQFSR